MSTIRIGTAPDSWGVWFPSDPAQLPAEQFLREVVDAGVMGGSSLGRTAISPRIRLNCRTSSMPTAEGAGRNGIRASASPQLLG